MRRPKHSRRNQNNNNHKKINTIHKTVEIPQKTLSSISKTLFLVSGWICSLFLGLLKLPSEIDNFQKKLPDSKLAIEKMVGDIQLIDGDFSSNLAEWKEKNMLADNYGEESQSPLFISIKRAKNSKFYGEIFSKEIETDSTLPFSRIMIKGKSDLFGRVQIEAYDIIGNEAKTVATFLLSVDDPVKETLRLKVIDDPLGILKNEIILWPTYSKIPEGNLTKFISRAIDKDAKPH
ncbi:hypothetical protein PWG14_20760 (plasmid) [Chromobacterium amazonense]|uniref:hypothetical protein n=1 Tax=Chromobacterium amazonense TaxID=1382803 RepID=UPI00237ED8B2|nr:hypothetical protein [Chromobacterium amazonense]MDE1714923.1 hypothetical protein [Chromobacterium amazonense]